MKKILAWLGGFVLVACITAGVILCVSAKVHGRSVKEEFKALTQQEQTVEKKEDNLDDEIVIEDENLTENEDETQTE